MIQSISALDYFSILPEILLGLWGVVTLFIGRIKSKSEKALYAILYGQAAILGISIILALYGPFHAPYSSFGGLLASSAGKGLVCLAFQATSLILAWMAKRTGKKTQKLPVEFYGILSAATVSLMLLTKANNFSALFVTLEAASLFITLMLAIGNPPGARKSSTGAIKYLLLSALSAAFLVWGIVLIYSSTGSLSYNELSHRMFAAHSMGAIAGAGLVLAALAFKLGLFPFCAYLPEIYESASWPVVGFLATLSKMAAAIALVEILTGPFAPIAGIYQPALVLIIILTLLWGALSALQETNLKRLLSLSGVVHAGFITAAVFLCTLSSHALQALGFYFIVYIAALLLILYCLIELNNRDAGIQGLQEGYERHPAIAIPLVLGFASLAGLPPLGGFMAKFFVFYNCILSRAWPLVGGLVIASIIALYYYLKVIFSLFGRQSDVPAALISPMRLEVPLSTRVFTGFLIIVILGLGLVQGPFSLLMQ